jgi:hypothetical protein
MASQRYLEPAAKCCTVHRRNYGFIRCLDSGDDVRQMGWLRRAPEFTNIGACYEGTASADNYDHLEIVVRRRLVDAPLESFPDWL